MLNAPKHIDYYAKFSPSPLSMKQFLDFGKLNNKKKYKNLAKYLCMQYCHSKDDGAN